MILNKKKYFFVLVVFIVALLLVARVFEIKFYSESNKEGYTQLNLEKESCLYCHNQTQGFSKYHNPKIIGCTACHLGNANDTIKSRAHKDMVIIPGNLNTAEATCAKCHADAVKKVSHSLMTTNSGLVAVDKFIFGEADSPDSHYHIKDIKSSPSDTHLRNLCAKCHLGAEKKEFGAITTQSRGGGCNACHLNYSDEAQRDLEAYKLDPTALPSFHPSTDITIKNEHCFGCHSRSSRISTNYVGWQETLKDTILSSEKKLFTAIADGRIYKIKTEDVHHTKGLLCIDCHSSHEVMGDGKNYLHQEDAVKIQCADCHFKNVPNTLPFDSLDVESNFVFMLRNYKHTDKQILKTKKANNPLVNTFVDKNDDVYLIGKGDGKTHLIKKQPDVCARDNAHQDVSCAMCHASWTPRCIGCHNQFDADDVKGYDLLSDKKMKGQWLELVAEFGASPPTMGVRISDNGKTIEPAIPGMIMTIDHGSFTKKDAGKDISFHRLYAPNTPHTIRKEVRDCLSCHTDPMALGFGKGTLTYNIKDNMAQWVFNPTYALNDFDGLPEDAWIPFLKPLDPNKNYSTRTNFRPINLKEQQNIMLVGACLQCHKPESKLMQSALIDGITDLLNRKTDKCIIPLYNEKH